ncbi:response regulator [Tamlana sp. 62-3]|uniref:Response regulator n=1 Tax=Neotamlana sargassicola TaxID=2883125 RepID=A0A9X1I943_9FLAO|nr:response regulator [Tamlana sargassicola]MCB4809084.1 response regulator [Tamlana sargassicola]
MKNILLIDDDLIYLKLTTHVLNKNSDNLFKVYIATSAQNGLDIIKEKNIDFIFLDINMPVTSGWEFLDLLSPKIKQNNWPTIFITSSTVDPNEKKKAKEHNLVHGFIEKPISNDTVLKFKQDFFKN